MFCPGPDGEPCLVSKRWLKLEMDRRDGFIHAQDGCTAPDVKDYLVLEKMSILVDGILVGFGPNLIFLQVFLCVSQTS